MIGMNDMKTNASGGAETGKRGRSRRRRAVALVLTALLATGVLLFWTCFSTAPTEPFVPTASERDELAFYSQPESWFIAHLQNGRETVDGQTLDPKLQYFAEQMRPASAWMARALPLIFATAPGRRWVRSTIAREWTLYAKVTAPMRSVEDRAIPGRGGAIPVRIYRPQTDTAGPLPVLVYAHGGG